MHRNSIVVIAVVVFLTGCFDQMGTDGSRQEQGSVYFEIEGYFEKEKQRLSTQTVFSKTVTMNGEMEESQLNEIDLENDLKVFIKSDINRPAWSDKYEIDSTFNQNQVLSKISYQANDIKLLTKSIVVDFERGEVVKVFIKNGTKSAIAQTRQLLTYQPNSGYSIESVQDVATMDESIFRIEVEFQ